MKKFTLGILAILVFSSTMISLKPKAANAREYIANNVTSASIYRAYFRAGYGYCDAQMLGAFWNTSPANAKYMAGKALLGLPGFSMNVPNKLTAARRIFSGQGVCNFSSDFSYQDAVDLASYWHVPISQSKAALTTKLESGNLKTARDVVKKARNHANKN